MKKGLLLTLLLSSFLFVSSVPAATYNEVGDVGESLASAQSLPGGTGLVLGTLSSDADLFKFGWSGGDFYVNSAYNGTDYQLFLFDANGVGIQGNDDGIAYAGPAYLQVASLAAGTYYLAISSYDYDPYSSLGIMFESYPYQPLYGPLNSGALSYWAGSSYHSGAYGITFGQVTGSGVQGPSNPTTGVPEPASLMLVGFGLLGLAASKKKIQ